MEDRAGRKSVFASLVETLGLDAESDARELRVGLRAAGDTRLTLESDEVVLRSVSSKDEIRIPNSAIESVTRFSLTSALAASAKVVCVAVSVTGRPRPLVMGMQGRHSAQLVTDLRARRTLDRRDLGWWGRLDEDGAIRLSGRLLNDPSSTWRAEIPCFAVLTASGVVIAQTAAGGEPSLGIRWSDVRAIDVEGVDEVRDRVRVGAVVLFGALGLLAKRRDREAYVSITTASGVWVIVVERVIPTQLRAAIEPITQPFAEAQAKAGRPPENSEIETTADPIDLLRQLAQLRDEGVITEADFEAKKADLLRRLG